MSGTDFFYENQMRLAEKLNEYCFHHMMAFYGNSGAEAVEAAMKLARWYKGKPGFIAFTGAFHGRTLGALSLTGSKAVQRAHYLPLQPVVHAPYPDCANCPFEHPSSDSLEQISYCKDRGCRCLQYLQDCIIDKTMPKEDCAAIVLEPIQGEGGYIVPPWFWFKDLKELAGRNELMIICDEVQAGVGRTGKFWAHQKFMAKAEDFVPDIITSAKGIASGMPLGIMLATGDIMCDWDPGSHASTFGGNPVSCAAALATIEVIEKENLMENAQTVGEHLGDKLRILFRDYRAWTDNPRGMGLMRAIDILGEGNRDKILMSCFDKGLILLGCGKNGIRFCPALNVTKEEVDTCVCIIEDSIKELV
jgi:4-aminobutyrate aminotransferase